MIQYKHYHDINEGYKDVYSQNASPSDIEIFASLNAFLRTNDSCFTYLPLEGKGYLLQVTNKGDIFSHGLADSISALNGAYAAEYIGQLETRYGKEVDNLPEGRLPLRRAEWGFHLGRQLKPIFAKVVDTLLYTDKPVVFVGQNLEELIRYVKVSLALLPAQFANTIGFSVCPESLPSYFGDKSDAIGKHIRLLATDYELGEDDTWEIIHVNQAQPSAEGLRPYAQAIDKMTEYILSGNGNRLNGLLSSVCPCFSQEGKVDTERLENALAVHEFTCEMNMYTAKALLKAKVKDEKYGDIRQSLVIDAVNEIFKKNALSAEDESLIESVRKDAKVDEYVKEPCGKYAFKKMVDGAKLTAMQESDVEAFLGGLPEEELTASSDALRPLFAKKRNISALSLLCKMYAATKREEFLKLITAYVNILDTYNYAQQSKEDFDGKILNVAEGYPDCKMDLLGAMLLSCYMPNVLSSKNERAKTALRLKAVAKSIKGENDIQKIEYIMRLKSAVEKCAEISFLEIRGADDFELLDKEDVTALVKAMKFEDCLALVNNASVRIEGYLTLQDRILSRLCSLNEVKANVSLSKNLTEYKQFMKLYRANLPDTDEIAGYISVLTKSDDLGGEIFNYRLDFVRSCYTNMPFASRHKIAKKASGNKQYEIKKEKNRIVQEDIRDALENDETSFSEKQKITELIIEEMRLSSDMGKYKNSTLNSRYLIYAYMFSVLFAVISAAILFSIPMIAATLLGVDYFVRIGEFFRFYHVIAILAVAILNMCAYCISWVKSNHDRIGSIKKATRTTVLYGILPVALYAIAYALVYFVV